MYLSSKRFSKNSSAKICYILKCSFLTMQTLTIINSFYNSLKGEWNGRYDAMWATNVRFLNNYRFHPIEQNIKVSETLSNRNILVYLLCTTLNSRIWQSVSTIDMFLKYWVSSKRILFDVHSVLLCVPEMDHVII